MRQSLHKRRLRWRKARRDQGLLRKTPLTREKSAIKKAHRVEEDK
jgi:hypothetical protein